MAITKETQPIGFVATMVSLVISSVMKVSYDSCDWSILFVMEDVGYQTTATTVLLEKFQPKSAY